MSPKQIVWLLWIICVSPIPKSYGQRGYPGHRDLVTQENNVKHSKSSSEESGMSNVNTRQTEKTTTSSAAEDDDEKKTLAQQVASGKYGLIQKELFSKPAKRPGIITYDVNPEVPKDNINNLGGLQPEEIWLAENHLLVLKGGGFSKEHTREPWPPIDNYVAPHRQVKIPPNPKVPPPFPVQLTEGGPIHLIQRNGSGVLPPFFDPRFPPAPFLLPHLAPNKTGPGQGNGSVGGGGLPYPPPPFPFPPLPPPFLPPPANLTELDEDDPSIYYPPPYDFVYQKDNSSFVPPGPLVPGIVLPPPPNFFAPLTTKNKTRVPTTLRPKINQIHRKPGKVKIVRPVLLSPKNSTKVHTVKAIEVSPPTVQFLSEVTTPSTGVGLPKEKPKLIVTTQPPELLPISDWIPIPGPKHFLLKNPIVVGSVDKPATSKPKVYLPRNNSQADTEPHILLSPYHRDKKGRQHFTTTNIYDGFKPIFVTSKPSRYKPALTQPAYPPNPNVKGTYYFFEEPHITEAKVIDTDSPHKQTKKPQVYLVNPPAYETNTLSTPNIYDDVTVKTQSDNGQIHTPQHVYSAGDSANGIPLEYFLYSKETKGQQSGEYIKVEQPAEKELNPPPPRRKLKKPGQSQSVTIKPPIYEYSFSAPGYGTIEAPKVGLNPTTTPNPVLIEPAFKQQPQYAFFEYQSSPKTINSYTFEQSTVAPVPSKTPVPYPELGVFSSDRPYPIYSNEPRPQEEITNKYFGLFGQKINQDSLEEVLTTVAPVKPPIYKSSSEFRKPQKQTIKFPEEQYGLPPIDEAFYKNQEQIQIEEYRTNIRKPSQPIKFPQQPYGIPVSYLAPQYDTINVRPGHPLHADIHVNFKKPPPPEPEAEYIDPTLLSSIRTRGNSYISYQLPGNGGHFYFLTPQAVNDNYQLGSSSFRYSDFENNAYFRRSASKHSAILRRKP